MRSFPHVDRVSDFLLVPTFRDVPPTALCRDSLFINMLKKVGQHTGGVYTGPAGDDLYKQSLLDGGRGRIDEQLESYLEHGRRIPGFAVLCSQRTNPQGRPLLCLCLATPKGTHFLRLVDCSDSGEDGQFLYERLAEVCEEVGPEHIVAVIMDGASANERAGKLLEEW